VAVRRWRKQLLKQSTWQEIVKFKQQVSEQTYDLVIDTQGLLKSALMASFANGVKCGQDKATAREPLASYFYDQKHHVARGQHAVIRNRETAALACGYPKPLAAADYGLNKIQPTDVDLPTHYVAGLHGTSKDSKLWPTAQWRDLAKALAEQQLSLVLPWVSAAEQTRAKAVAENNSNVVILPKLNIAQLASIIIHATAAVGVDTGLSHLATALSVPTVAIYTDTDPALTGVYPGAHAPAKNLGGKSQCPSAQAVMAALTRVKSSI